MKVRPAAEFYALLLLSILSYVRSMASQRLSLSLDDHLKRLCLGGVPEGLIGIENLIELEAMRNEEFGVDFVR
jgi:hypothetical protein